MNIIGHGVDLVEVARVQRMLELHGRRFIDRCFTSGEQMYAESSPRRRAEHYAARLACKEAVMKAIGTGWRSGIAWTDIDVVRDPSGQPRIALSGRCAAIARELGIDHWLVSLSHTEGFGFASVIGCDSGNSQLVAAPESDRIT